MTHRLILGWSLFPGCSGGETQRYLLSLEVKIKKLCPEIHGKSIDDIFRKMCFIFTAIEQYGTATVNGGDALIRAQTRSLFEHIHRIIQLYQPWYKKEIFNKYRKEDIYFSQKSEPYREILANAYRTMKREGTILRRKIKV